MYSPELASKLAEWKQRSAEGTMTREEYREVLDALRSGRLSALQQAKTTKKSKPAGKSAEELLKELGL